MIPWTAAPQALSPWNFPGKNTGVGCHFLHVYGEGADKAVFRLKSCPQGESVISADWCP